MWNSVTVLKDMMFLYAKEPEELTLETVQILFRHGIRTPISKIPFMEFKNLETMLKHSESGYTVPEWNNGVHTQMSIPYGNKMSFYTKSYEKDKQHIKGTCATGQLTKNGEQQLFQIGLHLRKKYISQLGFLSGRFDPTQVYVRSTDIDRTMQSAMSLLLGMYPPETRNDMTIPIHTREGRVETMYPIQRHCRKLRHLIQAQKDSQEYKDFTTGFAQKMALYPQLQDESGTPENWHNTIQMHLLNDMPIPKYVTPDLISTFEEMASKEEVMMHTKEISRLSIGQFLLEISQHFNHPKFKMYLYAGHDSTIIPMLSALDVYDGRFPPVATQVIFEMYRDGNKTRWLRIHYRDKDLQIPNVSYKKFNGMNVCKWSDFEPILKMVSLTEKEYVEECKSK